MVWPYKKLLILLALPLFLILVFGSSLKVSAFDLFGDSCNSDKVKGGNGTTSSVCASNNTSHSDNSHDNVVLRTINTAANIIAVVAGLIAVIMIIIAGFSYVTAGGNAEQTKSARSRIIYAAVGLSIIALSWTIIRFIVDKVLQ